MAADLLQDYEAKIAALERMVGRQALEIELLKGALKHAPRPKSASISVVAGPTASRSAGDASYQGCTDRALNAGMACLAQPVGLHAGHFHHMAAARDQFGRGLAVGVRDRAWVGPDPLGEQGDGLGIERVGFGEPSGGTREIPDLARIDHGE